MKIGIFGLPGSGKTTLWCLLTGAPGGPDPSQVNKLQLRTVKVRDERLERLRDDYRPKKFTPATIEMGDFPGVRSDAESRDRAGLAQLLAPARVMDALIIVLRAFEDPSIPSMGGAVDPREDWREIETEFLLSDQAIVEKRVEKLRVQVKKPTPTQEQDRKELALLERLLEHLEAEQPLSGFSFNAAEEKMITGYQFLSAKPKVPVVNRGESPPADGLIESLAAEAGSPVFVVAARNELEILELAEEEREVFREEFGIEADTRERIIQSCYQAAERVSFFTAGEKEVRAWTIRRGEPAVEAAGEIHTDIARGFIRAETVSFADYVACGGIKGAREKGQLRLEGKDYVVQDGDIIEFRFNV